MKIRLLILFGFLILLTDKNFAQGIPDQRSFPDSNFSWNETSDYIGSEGNDLSSYKKTDITFYDDGDTIVNNLHYRKTKTITVTFRYSYDSNSRTIYIDRIENNEYLFGLLRNDKQNKKVYVKDRFTNVEYVLFDFGLKLKDKITMNYFPTFEFTDYYVIRIDSTIDPNGVVRKVFKYSQNLADTSINSVGRYQTIIEGIGLSHGIYDENIRLPFEYDIRTLECIKLDNNRIFKINVSWINPIFVTIDTTENCKRAKFQYLGLENNTQNSIGIYPNPANDFIQFKLDEEIELLEIYDSKLTIVKNSTQLRNKFLDISQLPSGIYFCKVYAKGKYYSAKFLKK